MEGRIVSIFKRNTGKKLKENSKKRQRTLTEEELVGNEEDDDYIPFGERLSLPAIRVRIFSSDANAVSMESAVAHFAIVFVLLRVIHNY